MNIGNWQLDTVDGGSLSIDGGVMFGVVPQTLWKSVAPPDPQNRLRYRVHCVLARDGRRTILVDTGYGGKYSPLDRNFYRMDAGDPLLDSLAALSVAPEDVDLVLLSHLHFDHVGGATRYNGRREPVLTFPRARHLIGRLEWEDATGRAPELEKAYPIENLTPLENARDRVVLIEGNAQIAPGLHARLTGGHTRGHLAFLFESGGAAALCIGDLCPTTAHLRREWCLAYDTHLLDTRRNKPQLLSEAAGGQWWVLWPHDPKVAAGRVARQPKREFEVVDAKERL
jgi:glyoxylase-like metal-dependent hydrolase (beta-lactamase superfamily II)